MRCLLFICLLFGALPAHALDRLQAQGYLLPNGLQVLLKPGYDKGHVSIRLVVGVGFDDFPCAAKELPHLLEHLMFSGIDDSGEGGLEERMQALGGDWNAFTSNADTTFVIEAPARNQRKVLDLLMEVLTRTELTQERLDTVRRIVAREDGGHTSPLQRLLDKPEDSHKASNQLAAELGLKCAARSEVDDIPLEALQEALATFYAANNMTLIVVGDLDKLLPGYVQRVYGKLAATEPVERHALASAGHNAEQRRTLARGMLGDNARLSLILREPALEAQHDETWELVKANLEWALYSELRLKLGLSYGPSVDREVFGDSGLMSLVVDVDRNDLPQAEQAIQALLERLKRDGFQADSFTRLKQVAIDRQAWAVQGNSALADYYWGALNDYEDGRFNDPVKRIRAVSLESTNQALRQLLEQQGYVRIQKARFSYDGLYWLAVAALWVVVLLMAGWWWYQRRKHAHEVAPPPRRN